MRVHFFRTDSSLRSDTSYLATWHKHHFPYWEIQRPKTRVTAINFCEIIFGANRIDNKLHIFLIKIVDFYDQCSDKKDCT